MIDYKVILSTDLLDFEIKLKELKQDGWFVDQIATIEWVGSGKQDTHVEILFKVVKDD